MQTYTLVVAEPDTNDAIVGEVYNESGTIEESANLVYEEVGRMPMRDDWKPDERRNEVTADVTTLNLEAQRREGGFEFRLLGDLNEVLVSERVSDADWKLKQKA